MNFIQHCINNQTISEYNSGAKLGTSQEFLEMLMNAGTECVVVQQKYIDEKFFDLRSGIAGDMLQKVVNYRLRLAIVGDFSVYESKSLQAFIRESNRGNTIAFVPSVDEALSRLS